jgi:hypothetical protein
MSSLSLDMGRFLGNFARWLQDVPVLGHHQDRNEVDYSKAQELRLLRFLNIPVNDSSEPVDIHVLQQFFWILHWRFHHTTRGEWSCLSTLTLETVSNSACAH